MIYKFHCYGCGQFLEVMQTMKERHTYVCPQCKTECSRVYTMPRVKYNKGFYSDTLGRWVHSHKDFEHGLTQTRYETDMSEYVGDNSTPKDEWVERKTKKRKMQHQDMVNFREALERVEYDAQK